jgi:hypothetical protein
MYDSKVRKRVFGGRKLNFPVPDIPFKIFLDIPAKLLDGFPGAFNGYLNGTVRAIAHPPLKAEAYGIPHNRIPKADPLDGS